MLEGLYQVNWRDLKHSLGEAANVPGLLLSLASPVPEDRKGALSALKTVVLNHGVVCQATAFIVPFMLQLLENPLVEDKDRLLLFLADLANGNSSMEIETEMGLFESQLEDPEYSRRLDSEREWAENTRTEVLKGIPVYFHLLGHLNREIRAASAYLLASFSEKSEKIYPYLLRRLGLEHDALVRASLVFALGWLEVSLDKKCDLLESIVHRPYPPIIRLAAAMSLARLLQEHTPLLVIDLLLEFLSGLGPGLPDQYERLPWADGHLFGDLSLTFCHIGPFFARYFVPDLVRVIDRVDQHSALNIAYTLLYLNFERERSGPVAGPFTSHQAMSLESIADCEVLWFDGQDIVALLALFNLPDNPETIQTALERYG